MVTTQSDDTIGIPAVDISGPTDDEYAALPPHSQRLPDLSGIPLSVNLCAGKMTMTLEQLQLLEPGSIVTFSGCTPGHATLCYGERPLAQGELVNVEGNLGFRIVNMDMF